MSQVSCGYLFLLDPAIDERIEFVEASAQCGVVETLNRYDLGEAGSQDSVEGASTKQRGAPAFPRDAIIVSARDSFDQGVQAKPAQVVCHLARGHVVGGFPEQGSPMVPQVAVGKTSGQKTKHQKGAEQGLHGFVSESQTAGSLPIDLDRFIDPVECVFSQGTILADPLDVQ